MTRPHITGFQPPDNADILLDKTIILFSQICMAKVKSA